jgi:hypothetical protein
MASLGTLPPGDVGFYSVDWSEQLSAVAGDAIVGNLTVECDSPDLLISNVTLSGTAVTFNATSEVAALYSLVARAGFNPSGRRLSQRIDLAIGEPPATEPIGLDEARQHLRLDTSGNPPAHPDDLLVQGMITAARQYCEGETGLSIVTTKITDYRDAWTDELAPRTRWGHYPGLGDYLYHGDLQMLGRPAFLLQHAPVISVDELRYMDPSGVWQVLPPDQYRTIPFGPMLRLEPLIGGAWPACYSGGHGVVQIDYTAGFDSPIEEGLRTAIKMMIAVYYENRGAFGPPAQIPQGVSDMLDGYRVL